MNLPFINLCESWRISIYLILEPESKAVIKPLRFTVLLSGGKSNSFNSRFNSIFVLLYFNFFVLENCHQLESFFMNNPSMLCSFSN